MDISETKKVLDKVSPTFCAAKWYTSHLHLHLGKGHSCHHNPLHDLPKDAVILDPAVLCNTPDLVQQRQEMLKGQRPAGCSYCWVAEDLGYTSDRLIKSATPWLVGRLNDIPNAQNPTRQSPRTLELAFSNSCNFSCSYCGPTFSSSWAKEIRSEAFALQAPVPNVIPEDHNPFIEAFWRWFPELSKDLRKLRITGGEPLLSSNTFSVLEYLLACDNANLSVAVNSNMSADDARMDRFIDLAKQLSEKEKIIDFTLFASIDSWGEQAEFIRSGLDIALFEKNIRKYLESSPQLGLSFMITFQALSLPNFHLLLEKIKQLKRDYDSSRRFPIEFSITRLENPSHMNLLVLPREYTKHFDSYTDIYEEIFRTQAMGNCQGQVDRLRFLKQWMLEGCDGPQAPARRADFFLFFQRYEKITKRAFIDVFPEYSDFWSQCQQLAHKNG